jgi:hypothetical protein
MVSEGSLHHERWGSWQERIVYFKVAKKQVRGYRNVLGLNIAPKDIPYILK